MPPRWLAGVLAICLAVAAGCRKEETPAARLSASSSIVRLSYPESLPLTLEWTPLAPLEPGGPHPTVFVHLIDRPNHVLRTFDHELPGPWTVGQMQRDVIDLYQSALGPPLPPGRYMLTVGLYDPALGYRWRLATDGQDVTGRREYRVADVEALPGRSPDARFHFSGGWSAIESSSDRQVPGRRWLSGSGSLSIEPSPRPRTVRLAMRVEGEAGAKAGIAATCAVSVRERPAGLSWFEAVPVPGQPCEIRFEKIQASSSPAPARWLAVEVLAFRPGPG
ncbi:MAG: hypothetical protein ACRD1B_02440 [Thermoanaerobaculia bacterium]